MHRYFPIGRSQEIAYISTVSFLLMYILSLYISFISLSCKAIAIIIITNAYTKAKRRPIINYICTQTKNKLFIIGLSIYNTPLYC